MSQDRTLKIDDEIKKSVLKYFEINWQGVTPDMKTFMETALSEKRTIEKIVERYKK